LRALSRRRAERMATRGTESQLGTMRAEKYLGNSSDTQRARLAQTRAKRNKRATIVFALANVRERKRTHGFAASPYLSRHDAHAPQSRRPPFCLVPHLADLAADRRLRARGVRQPAGRSEHDRLRERSDG
jgi:hypothetical protein